MRPNEKDPADVVVKIRPAGILWIGFFGLGVALVAGAASELPGGSRLAALGWLTFGCFNLAVGLFLRGYGIDLTAEFAIVREFGPRRIPWHEVRAVVLHEESPDPSVTMTFTNDEPFSLPYMPRARGQKGDAPCERDFLLIQQWWLAHRDESDRPRPAP